MVPTQNHYTFCNAMSIIYMDRHYNESCQVIIPDGKKKKFKFTVKSIKTYDDNRDTTLRFRLKLVMLSV